MQQPLSRSKRKRADTTSSTGPSASSYKRGCFINGLSAASERDWEILNTVDARYHVQLQSVISSSKIQKRVSAMLRHLTSPAPPSAKKKVSVLRAKARDVSKLVSIAEIAKREIERERRTVKGKDRSEGAGNWFQYIALSEEMQQRDREEDNSIIEETVLGGHDVDQEPNDNVEFEYMKAPFKRAIEGQPLVRGTPVMNLFLSRSPIEELKKRYGEQTNIWYAQGATT
jgi:hypothetical protein